MSIPAECQAFAVTSQEFKDCIFISYTFHYHPSVAAAVAFAVLFALATCALAFRTYRHKNKWMWILVFTGCCEVAGYVARIVAALQPRLVPFLFQSLFLLLPPILFALVNYSTMGRLLSISNEKAFGIMPQRIARFFLASDFTTLFIQCSGGGMMVAQSLARMGSAIALVGLIVQLCFFAAFCGVIYVSWTQPKYGLRGTGKDSVQPAMVGMVVTISLMFLRNAYRVYEFAEGAGNNEAQEEWPFYAFESAPILLTVLAYTYWHFGKLLPDTPDAAWKQEVATACGKPWPPAGQCTDAADKLVTVTKSGPSNGAVAIAPTTDHDPSATDASSPASSVACAV